MTLSEVVHEAVESPQFWAFLVFHANEKERVGAVCLIGFMAWLADLLKEQST